jgi:hypothetical protein
MPAQEYVTGVARVVVSAQASGVNVVNVLHVANNISSRRSYTPAGIVSLTSALAGLWSTHLQPHISAGWGNATITCTDLTDALGPAATQAIAGSGGSAGTAAPNSVAACITWRIARHYRGGHPRTYIGPINNTAINNPTTLQGTYVTALQNAANAFRAAVAGVSVETYPQTLVCVHRVRNGANIVPPDVDEITSGSVDTRIDSMRRRLGKDR